MWGNRYFKLVMCSRKTVYKFLFFPKDIFLSFFLFFSLFSFYLSTRVIVIMALLASYCILFENLLLNLFCSINCGQQKFDFTSHYVLQAVLHSITYYWYRNRMPKNKARIPMQFLLSLQLSFHCVFQKGDSLEILSFLLGLSLPLGHIIVKLDCGLEFSVTSYLVFTEFPVQLETVKLSIKNLFIFVFFFDLI